MAWQMIRQFGLPSRVLGGYVARLYLARFFGILLGLVAVLQLLDLLAVTPDIMAAEGAGWQQIVKYVSLRMPQLMAQFVPFTALLATLLSLAGLSQHSEIIIMKASGLSAHRILLPLGLASALLALFHLTFNESVVVDATADLEFWQDNDYAIDLPVKPEQVGRAWLVEGNTIIMAESVMRGGKATILNKVSLFDRTDNGHLSALARAEIAAYTDGVWTLFDVRRFDVAKHEMTIADRETWETSIPPERFHAMTVRPDRVDIWTLWQSIQQLEDLDQNTESLMASFWQKLAAPASILLMPILGAIAGFGVHRTGTLLVRVITGMALGFAFFVADNFMLAMGEFGVAPPFVAAWSPLLLFLTVGYAVLFHTEE